MIPRFSAKPPTPARTANAATLSSAITTREVPTAAGMSKTKYQHQSGYHDETAADPEETAEQAHLGAHDGDEH